jgi:hypothetical protein
MAQRLVGLIKIRKYLDECYITLEQKVDQDLIEMYAMEEKCT